MESNSSACTIQQLIAAQQDAEARFRSYPNVLAIGVGAKFKRGTRKTNPPAKVEGLACIQFFVTRKVRSLKPHQRLPGFLYTKSRGGRRGRISTDVIPVGRIQAASCGAGSRLDSNRDHGLITLIFRNKVPRSREYFLISCAHVAGNMLRSAPAFNELTCASSSAIPFARTVSLTMARGDEIQYDIALAKIEAAALPLRELRVKGTNTALRSFLPLRSIQLGLGVNAALQRGRAHGTVDTMHASADIRYASATFRVHNLFGLNLPGGRGDSGGLVYRDSQAVGIVVAASPQGWLWFQPLEPAVNFLSEIAGIDLSVFNTPKENP
jgi:hypothetical protein